jgi:hypothetical protein
MVPQPDPFPTIRDSHALSIPSFPGTQHAQEAKHHPHLLLILKNLSPGASDAETGEGLRAEDLAFKVKQAQEIHRLEWLKGRIAHLADMVDRAVGEVEGSETEAGLRYDAIVADALADLAHDLQMKIEEDDMRWL